MSFHRPPDTAASPPCHPPPRRAGRDFASAAGATAVVLLALATACTSVRPPQRFDTHQLTAAHRTLPFGTVVEVHDLDNDRRVRVRINDRGPFVRHRVIDLSYAAARELDMIGPGTAHVELTVVATGPAPLPGGPHYTVQIAAFADPERAEALYSHLLPSYPEATVRSDGTWHRVQVGEFDQRRPAERLRRELARLGYTALVVTFR
jgi:peptidoglycan lytic transglycosylase